MSDHVQQLAPLVAAAPAPSGGSLRVAFRTLGCRLNQYDTEGIRAGLERLRPIEVVGWDEIADLYVLNSCTVTHRADQECRRLARQAKRRHPAGKVVVAGCYAQTQPDELAAVPEIDGVVGNADKDDVARWLPRVLGDEGAAMVVSDFAEDAVFDSPLIDAVSGRSRAFVKIQDGCNLRCTYCLIWKARGPGRSRTPASVIEQLQVLRAGGYREAILAGIHLGGYGRDLRPRVPLTDLVERILDACPDLRIRLSSIHPNEVTPALLDLLAQHERLRPHLHISLQSGSSTVLARMKRPYRGERAREALAAAAAAAPGVAVGADIIVGFPGETEEDYAATRALTDEVGFDNAFVFRYSPRKDTPAATMEAQLPEEVKEERNRDLLSVVNRHAQQKLQDMVGRTVEVLCTGPSRHNDARLTGRTRGNKIAVFEGPADLAGQLVDIDLTDTAGFTLYAANPRRAGLLSA
jgi:threonylcarbamoyladenosine tRNA methylthiotransferase MtaB